MVQKTSRIWGSVLVLLAFGTLALIVPISIRAQGNVLILIRQAIWEQGLHWRAKDYGRTFPLGALPEHRGHPSVSDGALLSAKQVSLPSSVDWREGGWVSPIKDQGNCGSCYAFAAVGALESLLAIDANTPWSWLDLSEAIVAFCSYQPRAGGCSGGYMSYTAAHMLNEGTYLEECFRYQDHDMGCQACANWQDNAYKIVAYQRVDQSVTALKAALQYGPLQTAFDVYGDFFSYEDGVYEKAWGSFEGGHAVLLVGYQDTPGQYGGGYFIVKNSWGPGWGEDGYFRIGYSQVTNEVDFGADSYLYFLDDLADSFEPDDAWYQAPTATYGVWQEHSFFPAGDSDWVHFHLNNPLWVRLETDGGLGGDTVFDLYDGSINWLAGDDDSGPDYFSLLERYLPAGDYYVRIYPYWSSDILASYRFRVSRIQAEGLFGQAETWSTLPAFNKPNQNEFLRVSADVNGDDKADIVLFHPTIGIKVALSDGSQFVLDGWWSKSPAFQRASQDQYPRFLADVNGDGMADAVLFHPTRGIKVMLSEGNRFGSPTWWSQVPAFRQASQDKYPRFLADVNGDGMADAVLFHPTKGIKVMLSKGNRFGSPTWWSQAPAFQQESQDEYPRLLADVNGDGMADAVLFHPTLGVKVALSMGSGFGTPEWWHDGFQAPSFDRYPRALTDVNGDGMADALLFDPNDGVRVALSDGHQFGSLRLEKPGFIGQSQNTYPRSAVDCSGDGRADLLMFTPAEHVQVARAVVP
ncbi:MAG: hypothetical protein H5T69_07600 [Chloroflexi bacterium]|nr:hypothetical protein [Chloroflexota bacterium]